MPIVMDNLDILGLTTQQLNKVRDIAQQNFKVVEQINAEYHLLKTELKETLLDGEITSKEAANNLVAELAQLDKKRMSLTVECAQGLKAILSPEQFDEIISLYQFQK